MKRPILAVLTVASLLGGSASSLFAQADWAQQVRRILQQGPGRTFERNGYQLTGEILTGSLANADSSDVAVELRGAREYKLVGGCDANCSDLNFALYDAAGAQVDLDDLPEDNNPIVTVAPAQPGQYRLRVTMAACSRAPCRFGIGVYGK